MMYKQNYTFCCKKNCCKQDNTQWKHFVGCKNYTKDSRNRTCVTRPSKGFVQNLKDKLVNLQNDSQQLQFVKKPVKKKQKDYYCLMLRKINSLDKKLQNLEHLFVSHLNHTPNEVFNSSDNEPLYDYMGFYQSVRSLVDLANRLKEDILYKQCNSHIPNRNTLHLNDRIQVLDSELENLYTYLDQLQNCSSGIKGAKQFFVQDYADVPLGYSAFRGAPKVENQRCCDFKEFQKSNKNKRKPHANFNEDGCNNPSSHCIECCYEADDDSPVSGQCSRCNLNPNICSMTPGNRRYSPKRFEHSQGRSIAGNSDCSCELCVNERKNTFMFRRNNLWESQSFSSCSCEICVRNSRKLNISCNKNSKGARIKIIKPVKKGETEDNFLSELQISYEMEPKKSGKKKKQKNKNQKPNQNEDSQETEVETVYYQDIGPGFKGRNSETTSNIKSKDSIIQEQAQGKFSRSQHSKTISPSKGQEKEVKNVVYYELTPDLNIITKRKNNIHVFNGAEERYRGKNKNAKRNKDKVSSNRDEMQRNCAYRLNTVNLNLRGEDPSNKFSKKVVKNERHSRDYPVNDNSSSENEQSNFYQAYSSDKNIPGELKQINETNGSTGKHLHITIRKKKEFEEVTAVEQQVKRIPERQNKYRKKHSQLHRHRRHSGFCHIWNEKDDNKMAANKRFSHLPNNNDRISESDSFETVEENGSDSDSSSSQYNIFFCDDPNCVEKLDSDELIMLMNKTDLKYCRANPYRVSIGENVKDLKSDVCEKCTIKEKTVSVSPIKTKNRNNDKTKFILKKEVIECSNCNKNKNDQLSETVTVKTIREYTGSDIDCDRNELREVKTNSSNINKRESHIKSPHQEDAKNNCKNKTEFKNKKNNQFLIDKDPDPSLCIGYTSKQTDNSGNNGNKTLTVATSNLYESTSFKMLKANSDRSNKALELPGFGNLININIERGSYSLNPQPEIINTQKGSRGALSSPKTNLNSSENKNINKNPIADMEDKTTQNRIDLAPGRSCPIGASSAFALNANQVTDNISKNVSNQLKTQSFCPGNNKSTSALDLVKNSEKEIKEVTIVKSEMFTKIVGDNNNSTKVKDDMKNYYNKDTIMYTARVNSGMVDDKYGKRLGLQSKKNNVKTKKETSLNYATEENPGNTLLNTQEPHYNVYGNRAHPSSNTQSATRKNIVKPRVSTTRVKRSRLKFNKKFGSSLSKVTSAHSIVVHQATFYPGDDCPFKKSSVFNPGRRISKLSKRRYNVYPRIYSLKENSLSGIIKPQMKIVLQENYQNGFKVPSNDSSNSRYKVASISNYLSSSVLSDSSYSTINWKKVAEELKEDDTYFNNIA